MSTSSSSIATNGSLSPAKICYRLEESKDWTRSIAPNEACLLSSTQWFRPSDIIRIGTRCFSPAQLTLAFGSECPFGACGHGHRPYDASAVHRASDLDSDEEEADMDDDLSILHSPVRADFLDTDDESSFLSMNSPRRAPLLDSDLDSPLFHTRRWSPSIRGRGVAATRRVYSPIARPPPPAIPDAPHIGLHHRAAESAAWSGPHDAGHMCFLARSRWFGPKDCIAMDGSVYTLSQISAKYGESCPFAACKGKHPIFKPPSFAIVHKDGVYSTVSIPNDEDKGKEPTKKVRKSVSFAESTKKGRRSSLLPSFQAIKSLVR